MSGSAEIDPVTLTVIWSGLVSIADEMGATLEATAFSEAVREGQDFSSGVFDRRGRLVAQGNFTPGHLGSMPYVVKAAMEIVPPESLRPGDCIALNDSSLGSGHFPDFFFIAPVFLEGDLVGWVCNTAHHIDVGGAAPGSQKVHGVTESFQEGLRVLPVRLVREGAFDPDLLRTILANVRVPEKVEGDLKAQLNAARTGTERLARLWREHGIARMEAACAAILDRSEARMRALIAEVPDGTYSFEDRFDDYGPGTEPILVAVDVTVAGDEITVDFSRSSDAVPAALNAYLNYTRAYTVFAVKVFCDALMPHSEGATRPIHVVAREGSFFNPRFPAPSGGRAAVQVRIFDAINGAFAQALPHRAMGAFSHWSNPNIGGVDPRTGRPFVMYDLMFGGYGGRADRDGCEALAPVMNCRNIPVEVHETLAPVRVRRLELMTDTGGAGRFRGGSGLRKDVELLADKAVLTMLGDRQRFAPYGLFGGEPGALGETVLERDEASEPISSKEVRTLRRGDVVSFRLAGAGGYGDPKDRDPARVKADVADGYVSPAAARKVYGVEP